VLSLLYLDLMSLDFLSFIARLPPRSTLFPYTTLFRSERRCKDDPRPETLADGADRVTFVIYDTNPFRPCAPPTLTPCRRFWTCQDRKSTRLNSSHVSISYAVFCLKKKNLSTQPTLHPM